MALIENIFKEEYSRDHKFLVVCYMISKEKIKAKRVAIYNDLLKYLESEVKEFENFKIGNTTCLCGNSIDPEDNTDLCDDCLEERT